MNPHTARVVFSMLLEGDRLINLLGVFVFSETAKSRNSGHQGTLVDWQENRNCRGTAVFFLSIEGIILLSYQCPFSFPPSLSPDRYAIKLLVSPDFLSSFLAN